MIILRPVLLRMNNVSDESCKESQHTHFVFNTLFPPKILPFMRYCGKNILEPDRLQMPVWRMHVTCWMRKATNTHSEYVTVIAFSCQQWSHERASILRCTSCLLSCYWSSLRYKLSTFKRVLVRDITFQIFSQHWNFYHTSAAPSKIWVPLL